MQIPFQSKHPLNTFLLFHPYHLHERHSLNLDFLPNFLADHVSDLAVAEGWGCGDELVCFAIVNFALVEDLGGGFAHGVAALLGEGHVGVAAGWEDGVGF